MAELTLAGLALAGAVLAGSAARAQGVPATGAPELTAKEAKTAPDPAPLVDEKRRSFRILTIEKRPGTFYRVDAGHVRIFGGYTFEILTETDAEFTVKQYLAGERTVAPPVAPAVEPVDAEAMARSYAVTLPDSDVVRLVPADAGLPRAGQWRDGFDLGDLDGDGYLEIVFGPARKGRNTPNVFRLGHDGSWKAEPATAFPGGTWGYGAARAADFDGDGKLDLAFGLHLLGMRALFRDGDRFVDRSSGMAIGDPADPSKAAFSTRAFDVADWDGDGHPDLVALGEGPSAASAGARAGGGGPVAGSTSNGLVVYLNRGASGWERAAEPSAPAKAWFGGAIAVADLDRDGDLDVVLGVQQIGFSHLLGYRGSDGTLEWRALPGLRPKALVDSIAVADLDRDGWNDLAVGYRSFEGVWRSGVDLFFGGAAGFERVPLAAVEGKNPVAALAVGDLDGDGGADVAAFPSTFTPWIFISTGRRLYGRENTAPEELGAAVDDCTGYDARIADLDGDGRSEIVAAFADDPGARGLLGVSKGRVCNSGGGLRVWSVKRSAPR